MSAASVPAFKPAFADTSTSFFRTLRSEFMKLNLKGIWISFVIAVVLQLGIAALFNLSIDLENSGTGGLMPDLAEATALLLSVWSVPVIFFVIVGALAVTSEYSSNTMRSTVLADPHRERVFFAKIVAVGVLSAIVALLMGLAVSGIAMATLTNPTYSVDVVLVILRYTAVMAILAILATCVGFILRSTAGTIAAIVLVLMFADLLRIVPNDLVKKIAEFTPSNLGMVAIDKTVNEFLNADIVTNSGIAFGGFAGYLLIFGTLGLVLYKIRDA